MAKKQFKAESKRLLDLMINSIYTHTEIFLREIISNASDAIDKLCYRSLTEEGVGMSRSDFAIRITADKASRTLTVSDNGVGMTKEDMENNLGVIARSGSLKFKNEMDDTAAEDLDIIGQFGVGFYSAFMVADKVTVISRAYGSESACKWESAGADGYTVTECEKASVGTDVIMHLKADSEDERYSDYLESYRLKELVKKYSDYVRWPIRMDVENVVPVDSGEKNDDGSPKMTYETRVSEETVNSMVPIWQRSKADVSDDDCRAFYKEKFHDAKDPVALIRVNAEGAVSYKAMLFIPETTPYDYYTRDFKPGLQLYSNGVMIMEKCADLLPECFRFVRGVVDSPDLSLNISRELLQHDRQLKIIAANLEKKIKGELKRLMDKEPEKYELFFKAFGLQLKYGILEGFGMKRDLLADLLIFDVAGEEKKISLHDYVSAMPECQKSIYYCCGESKKRCEQMPQTELVKERGFKILCLSDDVDEFVMQMLGMFEEKNFCSVLSDDLGLETEDEKAAAKAREESEQSVLDFVKEALGGTVVAVRLSHKLRSHPACLATEGDVTLEMEKYFQSLPEGTGGSNVKAKRVLELNADHAAFDALKKAKDAEPEKAKRMAMILLAQATLMAGLPLEDPSAYTELVCSLF